MKIKTNSRNDVSKFTHDDGSETTIKIGVSREYADSDMQELQVDRQKYSVMISTSVGCQMGCKMCGINPATYFYLSSKNIIENVRDAIRAFGKDRLKNKYVKLCFMGMGEPLLRDINMSTIPAAIIRWILNHGYACGIDGVDYGTILPTNAAEVVSRLTALNTFLVEQYGDKRNVHSNWIHRSLVRVFYSLHACDQATRSFLIPKGKPLKDIDELYELNLKNINVIMHYTLIEGVNDSAVHLGDLIQTMKHSPFQLRMLRYNSNGYFQESTRFRKAWEILEDNLPNVKLQISPGKDVKGACGQFY